MVQDRNIPRAPTREDEVQTDRNAKYEQTYRYRFRDMADRICEVIRHWSFCGKPEKQDAQLELVANRLIHSRWLQGHVIVDLLDTAAPVLTLYRVRHPPLRQQDGSPSDRLDRTSA